MILHKIVSSIFPYSLRKRFYYYTRFKGLTHKKRILEMENKVRNKRPIKVLFIAVNIPMWRNQGIYELLKKDDRFEVRIIITKFGYYSEFEAQRQSEPLKEFFRSKGIDATCTMDEDFDVSKWLEDYDPDIIFNCQPYERIHGNALDIVNNKHRLYAYTPYALLTINNPETYNSDFHNRAWRVYNSTILNARFAKKIMHNNASNCKVVGEPDYDKFQESSKNPWKIISDGNKRKKLIWAPHFSVAQSSFISRTSFMWLYDEMIRIAYKYSDCLQIAFKPHPNLYNKLSSLSEWGKERTDRYYKKWSDMETTQLEEGDFVDLFKTSDAMIHDCGSFTGEYLMVNRPVMFATKDEANIRSGADYLGARCLDMHYFGSSVEEVEQFIIDKVLGGNDPLKSQREDFYRTILTPPNSNTVAENIYNDILDKLHLSIE